MSGKSFKLKLAIYDDGTILVTSFPDVRPGLYGWLSQALCAEYMTKNHTSLEKRVYSVPEALDKQVAKMKLESMAVKIDRLSPEQEQYLASWSEGT